MKRIKKRIKKLEHATGLTLAFQHTTNNENALAFEHLEFIVAVMIDRNGHVVYRGHPSDTEGIAFVSLLAHVQTAAVEVLKV